MLGNTIANRWPSFVTCKVFWFSVIVSPTDKHSTASPKGAVSRLVMWKVGLRDCNTSEQSSDSKLVEAFASPLNTNTDVINNRLNIGFSASRLVF